MLGIHAGIVSGWHGASLHHRLIVGIPRRLIEVHVVVLGVPSIPGSAEQYRGTEIYIVGIWLNQAQKRCTKYKIPSQSLDRRYVVSKHNWVPQNGVSIGGVSINSKQGDTNKTNRRSNADATRHLLYFVKVLQDLGACSSHTQASNLEPS